MVKGFLVTIWLFAVIWLTVKGNQLGSFIEHYPPLYLPLTLYEQKCQLIGRVDRIYMFVYDIQNGRSVSLNVSFCFLPHLNLVMNVKQVLA